MSIRKNLIFTLLTLLVAGMVSFSVPVEAQNGDNLGTIIIEKVTDPPGGTDFLFEASSPMDDFSLDDGESRTFNNLPAGVYEVPENLDDMPSGWVLDSITCEGGDFETFSTPEGVLVGVLIDLEANETITCTFTNTQEQPPETGSITIAKEAENAGDQMFEIDGDLGKISFTAGSQGTQGGIPIGDYTMIENVPDGWALTDVTCTGGDSTPVTDGVTIHLDAGEHITCTFTNEHQVGSITIAKEAENAGNQMFEIDGDLGKISFTAGSQGTQEGIPIGDYTMIENVPEGWVLTDVTCTGGDSTPVTDGVTIHLDTDEHITCTFTNTKEPEGDVEITKVQKSGVSGWTDDLLTVNPGDTISYMITVESFFDVAVDLMIYDALDALVEYVGSLTGSYGTGAYNPIESRVEWEVYDLPAYESLWFSFDVVVRDDAPPGSIIENMATVYYPDPIAPEIVKSDSVQVEVVPEPATVVLFGFGLLGIFTLVRRRRKQRR